MSGLSLGMGVIMNPRQVEHDVPAGWTRPSGACRGVGEGLLTHSRAVRHDDAVTLTRLRAGPSAVCRYSPLVSVSKVASGGQAKRTGVYLFVPQPAETCMYDVRPAAVWVERPFARSGSRSQLVTSAP